MLIVCPTCAKSYHIARTSLGAAGRSVQCSKCFSRWHCAPEGVVAPAPEPDAFAPEIITRTDKDLHVPSKSVAARSSADSRVEMNSSFNDLTLSPSCKVHACPNANRLGRSNV